MTEFTSDIKTIPFNETEIFEVLSDLTNLERLKDKIPQDKINDFSFDKDSKHEFVLHLDQDIIFSL